jgi:hypothetical protein
LLEAFGAREVLRVVARLQESAKGEGTGIRLSAVAEETQMTAEVLLPLARRLETQGLLETHESNAFGDNLVSLTQRGVDLSREKNLVSLFGILGLQ